EVDVAGRAVGAGDVLAGPQAVAARPAAAARVAAAVLARVGAAAADVVARDGAGEVRHRVSRQVKVGDCPVMVPVNVGGVPQVTVALTVPSLMPSVFHPGSAPGPLLHQ